MQWSEVGAVLGVVLGFGAFGVSLYGLRHSASSARASAVSADAANESVRIAERALEAEERRYQESRSADLRVERIEPFRERGSAFLRFHFRNAGPATANGVQLSLRFKENPGVTETLGPPAGVEIKSGDTRTISAFLPKSKLIRETVWVKVNVEYYDINSHRLELVYSFANLVEHTGITTALRVAALDGKRHPDCQPRPPKHDPFPIPEWLRILD